MYKLFDLRKNGALGKRIDLKIEDDDIRVRDCDATLEDTLEKLVLLNDCGGHPTEIMGLTDDGRYLIIKQPLAQRLGTRPFHAMRDQAIDFLRCVIPQAQDSGNMLVSFG